MAMDNIRIKIGYNGTIESQIVMRIRDGITTLVGDVVDAGLEVAEVCSVEWTSQSLRAESLHGECNTECIESLAEKIVIRLGCWLEYITCKFFVFD